MCGIIGILSNEPAAQDIYDGMIALQHRGQDACGMATYDGVFHLRKSPGLVRDVFHTRHMKELSGYAGIGHTRYATMGSCGPNDAQPFLGPAPFGIVLAHNGNLFNARELRKEIFEKDQRLINSTCDAEILLNIFSKSLTKSIQKDECDHIRPHHIWEAVKSVHKRSKGAYSVIAYIAGQGLIAFRDPYGIRPLLFGEKNKGLIKDYMFISESVGLNLLEYKFVRDVGAGEAIFIDEKTREVHSKIVTPNSHTPCLFEYIYFARPDSVFNEISVYKSRIRMGENLAKQIKNADIDIDVVMPVPDSSRTAALALSDKLNIKYREGLIKNRYIGRTFIMPGQEARKKSIRYKLNPMRMEIEGKKILLVDDSIVRGNTSRKIIQIMREAGAKKVYLASYAPPVTHPCLYGIDIPTPEELIASNNNIENIRKQIGADALFYGGLEESVKACLTGNPKIKKMCAACFCGKYPTGDIDDELLKKHALERTAEKACDMHDEDLSEEGGQMNLV